MIAAVEAVGASGGFKREQGVLAGVQIDAVACRGKDDISGATAVDVQAAQATAKVCAPGLVGDVETQQVVMVIEGIAEGEIELPPLGIPKDGLGL